MSYIRCKAYKQLAFTQSYHYLFRYRVLPTKRMLGHWKRVAKSTLFLGRQEAILPAVIRYWEIESL